MTSLLPQKLCHPTIVFYNNGYAEGYFQRQGKSSEELNISDHAI